jgi:hypothetical protein
MNLMSLYLILAPPRSVRVYLYQTLLEYEFHQCVNPRIENYGS